MPVDLILCLIAYIFKGLFKSVSFLFRGDNFEMEDSILTSTSSLKTLSVKDDAPMLSSQACLTSTHTSLETAGLSDANSDEASSDTSSDDQEDCDAMVQGAAELNTSLINRHHIPERAEDAHDSEEEEQTFAAEAQSLFDDPISLINMEADLKEFLNSKRISDAVKVLTRSFPELPSKKRVPNPNAEMSSLADKGQDLKRRNRENAALTRKRLKIYAEFMDKAIEELTLVLSGKKEVDIEKLLSAPETRPAEERPRKKRIRARRLVLPIPPRVVPEALISPQVQYWHPPPVEDVNDAGFVEAI